MGDLHTRSASLIRTGYVVKVEGWKDKRTEDGKGKRDLELRPYHRESVWERYVVKLEGWEREKDFVLIIERRVWRKGGRIENAKRNLSRLVERGYLKKHMVEVEGRKKDFS